MWQTTNHMILSFFLLNFFLSLKITTKKCQKSLLPFFLPSFLSFRSFLNIMYTDTLMYTQNAALVFYIIRRYISLVLGASSTQTASSSNVDELRKIKELEIPVFVISGCGVHLNISQGSNARKMTLCRWENGLRNKKSSSPTRPHPLYVKKKKSFFVVFSDCYETIKIKSLCVYAISIFHMVLLWWLHKHNKYF